MTSAASSPDAVQSYEDLVNQLVQAMSQRSLFHRDHPRVRAACRDFARDLGRRLESDHKEAFFLGLVHGRLVHEGRFLFGSTLLGRKLVTLLSRLCSGGLLLRAKLREEDVAMFLDLATELREPLSSLEEARQRLAPAAPGIELSPPYEDPAWFGQFLYSKFEEVRDGDDSARLLPVFDSMFDTVERAHTSAGSNATIDADAARTTSERVLGALHSGGLPDLLRVVRYPSYDTYTVGHSVRVALLAVQVGRKLGLAEPLLIELGTASLLHDVGKAKLPSEILFKCGPLTTDERQLVIQHPRIGAELLLENPNAGELSIGAAFGHHLRHDGGGYPVLPTWYRRGRTTSIVQACDVFEALTAVRPYKAAMTTRRAFEVMLQDRRAFDPAALRALIACQGLYPPGTRVELTDGRRGVVCEAGADIERPKLRVTHDEQGRALPHDEETELDLGSELAQPLAIAHALVERAAPVGPDEACANHC